MDRFYRPPEVAFPIPIRIKTRASSTDLIQTVVAVQGICDDPYPFRNRSQLLEHWLDTEPAKWVLERALDQPICFQEDNPIYESTNFYITVKLRQHDAVIWQLKWGTQDLTGHGF